MLTLKVIRLFALCAIVALSCLPTKMNAFPIASVSKSRTSSVVVVAALPSQQPSQNDSLVTSTIQGTVSKMTAAFITANTLLVPIVLAIVEDDNYEYGAVDAPIGIAVGGGLLAILTALLPIALKGGEEAFEEIKDRDVDTFGKRNTDLLKKKK